MAPITFTCPTCGQPFTVAAEAADQPATCPKCGEPQVYPPNALACAAPPRSQAHPPAPVGKPAPSPATTSLVLGILSLFSCLFVPLLVLALAAIVCGHLARSPAPWLPWRYQGATRALVGLCLGYFSVVMFLLLVAPYYGLLPELVSLPDVYTPIPERVHRINCAANVKVIGLACKMYADDYNGTFPPDLKALWRERYLDFGKAYICPSSNTSPADSVETLAAHCDYLYFGKGLTRKQVSNPAATVLACDRIGNHTRTWYNVLAEDHVIAFDGQGFWNIVFVDDHVGRFSGRDLAEVARQNNLILPVAESAIR